MNKPFDRDFDPYKTLGVTTDASADEIKRAYRRLAKEYHPDRCGDDKSKEARFKDVSNAYEVLGDRDKRARYDALRGGAGPTGHIDLGDLFSQIFGGGMGGMGGNSRYRVVNEPFGGAGFAGSPFGFGGDPFAGGGGARPSRTPSPKPKPKTPVEKTVRAKDGSKLTKRGAHVYSDVRIQFDQAVLGTVVPVSTLAGSTSVKVPPGTSSGAKLRLKGKGPKRSDGSHGNHIVTVHIDVPDALDEAAKELLAEFMGKVRGKRD